MTRDEKIILLLLPVLEKAARKLRDFNYQKYADSVEHIKDEVRDDLN